MNLIYSIRFHIDKKRLETKNYGVLKEMIPGNAFCNDTNNNTGHDFFLE